MTEEKTLRVTKPHINKTAPVTKQKIVFIMTPRHGKLLAQARTKMKLTQAQLANKVNVKQSIISSAETGKGELPKGLCLKINEVLNEEIFK